MHCDTLFPVVACPLDTSCTHGSLLVIEEREHTRSAHSSLPDSERMFINLPSLYQRHAINECYRYIVMRSRCIEAEMQRGGARPTVNGKGFTRELHTSPDKECIKDHNMFDIRVNLTYGDKMRYTVSRNDLGRCQSLIWHPTNSSRIRVGIQPTRRTRRARKRVGMMLVSARVSCPRRSFRFVYRTVRRHYARTGRFGRATRARQRSRALAGRIG